MLYRRAKERNVKAIITNSKSVLLLQNRANWGHLAHIISLKIPEKCMLHITFNLKMHNRNIENDNTSS